MKITIEKMSIMKQSLSSLTHSLIHFFDLKKNAGERLHKSKKRLLSKRLVFFKVCWLFIYCISHVIYPGFFYKQYENKAKIVIPAFYHLYMILLFVWVMILLACAYIYITKLGSLFCVKKKKRTIFFSCIVSYTFLNQIKRNNYIVSTKKLIINKRKKRGERIV